MVVHDLFFRSHNEWLKYLKFEQFFFKIFTTHSPYFLQYGNIIHKRRLNRSFGITNKHSQYKLAPYASGMEKGRQNSNIVYTSKEINI